MQLKTKRLLLRMPKKTDWKDLLEGVGEYEVAKRLSSIPHPYSKKDAISFIKKTLRELKHKVIKNYLFYMELKSEKKVIGAIGIHKISKFNGTAEIGAWINKKY